MRSVAASDGHPNAAQPVPKRSHLAPNPNAVISNAATKVSLKALEIPPGTQTVLVVPVSSGSLGPAALTGLRRLFAA